MQSLLKELLPERRIHAMMKMAERINGFCYTHATWRIARLPNEIYTDDILGVIDDDLEIHAHLWFRRSWAGRDGCQRRKAAFALAIYVPQRSERRLFLERDLNASLAHLSEPSFGYDSTEKCWINDEYDQVHRFLAQRDADMLWNRDDFGRDLAAVLFE